MTAALPIGTHPATELPGAEVAHARAVRGEAGAEAAPACPEQVRATRVGAAEIRFHTAGIHPPALTPIVFPVVVGTITEAAPTPLPSPVPTIAVVGDSLGPGVPGI